MDANSTLFRLVHLRDLDLSDNDFNYSQIPSKIGELYQLRYLNLSNSIFSGEIPPQISQLSKLLSIGLGFSAKTSSKGSSIKLMQLNVSSFRSIIQNSTKLEILLLSYVTISSILPDTLTNLTLLKELSLYNSELYGEFPIGVFHMPNLVMEKSKSANFICFPQFIHRRNIPIYM
jgi:Leucine-rich repeat (LRR) protein